MAAAVGLWQPQIISANMHLCTPTSDSYCRSLASSTTLKVLSKVLKHIFSQILWPVTTDFMSLNKYGLSYHSVLVSGCPDLISPLLKYVLKNDQTTFTGDLVTFPDIYLNLIN